MTSRRWRSWTRTHLLAGAGLSVPAALRDSAGTFAVSGTEFEPRAPRPFPEEETRRIRSRKGESGQGNWEPRGFSYPYVSRRDKAKPFSLGVLLAHPPSSEQLI